jgi:hypothetical protein
MLAVFAPGELQKYCFWQSAGAANLVFDLDPETDRPRGAVWRYASAAK